MPINNDKYKAKEWKYVSVNLGGTTGVKYAFPSHQPEAVATDLGHILLTKNADLVIIGAKYPKPPRAIKQLANGAYVSSFIGLDKIAGSKAAGYSLIRSKAKFLFGQGTNSNVFKVDIGDFDYAYRTPLSTIAKITAAGVGAIAGLSLITTQSDASKCISGTKFPRPPQFKIKYEGDTIQGFCKPDTDIAVSDSIQSVSINQGIFNLGEYTGVA